MSPKRFWKICKQDSDVDCGLLRNTRSLEWKKVEDSNDELQHEMDKNQAAFLELSEGLKAQVEVITVAQGRFMMMLAEVIQTN